MSNQRHVFDQNDPGLPEDYDEQFWPVAMAICILAALTTGTILTVLRGPWMWGSLFTIPILVGLGLWAIAQIEQRFWRRSSQFAMLLSLTFHLFFLLVAYRTEVPGGHDPVQIVRSRPTPRVVHLTTSVQPINTARNQRAPVETSPTEIATERQPNSDTSQTQPARDAIASNAQSRPSPRLERNETSAEVTPRAGQSLSRRSRQSESNARETGELNLSSNAPTGLARSEPRENRSRERVRMERRPSTDIEPKSLSRRETDSESSEQARARSSNRREERPAQPTASAARRSRRTPKIEPDLMTAPRQPSRNSRAENSAHEVTAADVAAERRQAAPSRSRPDEDSAENSRLDRQPERGQSTQVADSTSAPQPSSRTQRRSRAPTVTSVRERARPATRAVARNPRPSPESSQITRQQIENDWSLADSLPSEPLGQTASNPAARQLQRRTSTAERSGDRSTSESQPRLVRNPAPALRATDAVDSSDLAATSRQPTRSTLEAKPLALQRASEGTTGIGSTPNFGRAADSADSPEQIASDSSRRERAQSLSDAAQAATSGRTNRNGRSTVGLESTRASTPRAIANTAGRATGNEPQPLSASSAASVSSASTAGRGSAVSPIAGSAELDLGPTKIVSGATRRDSAGGGQSELSSGQPSSSGIAANNGRAQASISADVNADTMGATAGGGTGEQSGQRGEPGAASLGVQKRGGRGANSQGPSRGELGDSADLGSAVGQSRQSTGRSSRRSSRGGEGEVEGEESTVDGQGAGAGRASVARQANSGAPDGDGPVTGGRANGTGQGEISDGQSNDEAESANSEIARSDRSGNGLGTGPSSKDGAEEGLAGTGTGSRSSNSLRRRGDDESDVDAGSDDVIAAGGQERSPQDLQLEGDFSGDGSESARGAAANTGPGDDESDPRSLEPFRASGSGLEAIGPSSRGYSETAATSSGHVGRSGRAGSTSQSEFVGDGDSESSKPKRSGGNSLDVDDAAALAGPANNGTGAAANPDQNNDRVLPAKRTETAQARVDIDSNEGAGGLGQNLASTIGVASRHASPNSDVVALEPTSRFRRRDANGELAMSPNAQLAKAPFMNRNPGSLGRSGPKTEQAIELGLAFLIRNQQPDGHWSLLGFDDDRPNKQDQLNSDTAATGLALLAFQGAGYTHLEFKYADRLKRSVAWLVSHQRPDGNLYVESDKESNKNCQLYSHAIAALALAEAYGMTQDREVRAAAQKAIDFIVETQDPKLGGWRYYSTAKNRSTDTSVTGWMVMALHSARLAGLDVDPKVWNGIDRWLEIAQAPDSESQYIYSPEVSDDPSKRIVRSHLRRPANSTTAIGLLMRMYTGWDQDDPRLVDGANVLLKQMPSEANLDVRDTYYWYYATQVLRHVDGPVWQSWNSVLHPLLLSSQVPDGEYAGSWSPFEPVEDKWGRFGGRLYVTTLNLLSLEVDYRLLPLYEKTVAPRDKSE